MKVSYNWLKWYISEIPTPEELGDIFTYHLTEVEGIEKLPDGDTIFDLNILPNRAHDLLSHSGIARELSGQLGISFTDPTKTYQDILVKKEVQSTSIAVDIQTPGCRRYMARVVRNIKVGPSPEWVVKHLESIGQRSINNIVDATNLVMFNCGQPVHAFDVRKFADQKVLVTTAKEGEELELVGRDKIVAKLKDTDVVIANSAGETLALAGVKGGTNSGIADDTADILIEIANFDPISVRKTARRIGVLSDAAKRYENDLSPELCDFAMMEMSALLMETCPDAVLEEVVDVYPVRQEERNISFSLSQINKILGANISSNEVEKILSSYNYQWKGETGEWTITVPPLRLDLTGPHDMAEEIGRIYGYHKISGVLPELHLSSGDNVIYQQIQAARQKLLLAGYREVMTYTFRKKGDLEVARGLKGKDALRANLHEGLKEAYEINRLNAPLLGQSDTRIFEIGAVFPNGAEEIHVAAADKTGAEEMPLAGFIAPDMEFHPEQILEHPAKYLSMPAASFTMWSAYPFIARDIAMWVPQETDSEKLYAVMKDYAGEYLAAGPTLFDTFTKDGRTSYAFRLVFQAKDRTLTDEEIAETVKKITEALAGIPGLELR